MHCGACECGMSNILRFLSGMTNRTWLELFARPGHIGRWTIRTGGTRMFFHRSRHALSRVIYCLPDTRRSLCSCRTCLLRFQGKSRPCEQNQRYKNLRYVMSYDDRFTCKFPPESVIEAGAAASSCNFCFPPRSAFKRGIPNFRCLCFGISLSNVHFWIEFGAHCGIQSRP